MEVLTNIIFWILAFTSPVIFAVWFFGIRPFVARHGKPRITGANWGVSMWADWTTACEIGKETGNHSRAARAFLSLWLIWGGALATILITGNFY